MRTRGIPVFGNGPGDCGKDDGRTSVSRKPWRFVPECDRRARRADGFRNPFALRDSASIGMVSNSGGNQWSFRRRGTTRGRAGGPVAKRPACRPMAERLTVFVEHDVIRWRIADPPGHRGSIDPMGRPSGDLVRTRFQFGRRRLFAPCRRARPRHRQPDECRSGQTGRIRDLGLRARIALYPLASLTVRHDRKQDFTVSS